MAPFAPGDAPGVGNAPGETRGDAALAPLVARIRALGPGRRLVALAGPPGAGKTTLAARLAAALGPEAAVVPMDGFHLDNRLLSARGLLARKGAPETFDAAGLRALLGRIAAGEAAAFPLFDRARDIAIAQAGEVTPAHRLVLVEGNYLLLRRPVWQEMRPLWSLSVRLEVPEVELERRLVARWRAQGLDDAAAKARAAGNDMANARLVAAASAEADVVLSPEGIRLAGPKDGP